MSTTNELPTPETYAAYQGISDEGMRRTVKQRTAMQRLERERDEAREKLKTTRRELTAANKGAERCSHINNSLAVSLHGVREALRNAEAELSVAVAERDDFRRKMIDLEEHVAKLKLERSELWVEIAAAKHRHEKQLEAMRTAIRSLSDLVEHIGECEERDLLRCDSDPHPPSVFSVYAQQASAAIAKLRPLLQ